MSAKLDTQGAVPTAYSGPDRRERNGGVAARLPGRRLLLTAAIVVAGAGAPALLLLSRRPDAMMPGIYLAVATALLCVIGGVTWLVTWRVAGRALQGWLGCAFIVLGVLTFVSKGVSNFGVGALPAAEPLDDLLVTVIAGGLVWRSLTDHEVNAALHPMVTLFAALGTGTAGMGLLNVAGAHQLLGWAAGAPCVDACSAAGATIWLVVAVVGGQRSAGEPVQPWMTGAASLFAVGCVARTFEPWSELATTVALGCLFLGAALADGTAITRLQGVLASGDRLHLQLHTALDTSRREARSEHEQFEEWIHDVRNAVAGLQAANAVLRAGTPSGGADHAGLADAVSAELARLHTLVDTSRRTDIVDVDLGEALEPIFLAERARGTEISAHLGGLRVRADRSSLCRVLQNVLLNARRYAAGTPVVVDAQRVGGCVELRVRDGGPGVPPHQCAAMLERGARGDGAGVAGSGLGLYVARTLARAMDGELCVRADGLPGCCVVLTLPAGGAPSVEEAPVLLGVAV